MLYSSLLLIFGARDRMCQLSRIRRLHGICSVSIRTEVLPENSLTYLFYNISQQTAYLLFYVTKIVVALKVRLNLISFLC